MSEVFADGMLDGRVVLVTGGGTGVGRAAAAELVACGASVVIAGRRADVLEATASSLGARWVSGDVRVEEDAARLVDFCVERCGRLDALVNNAGGQYFVPAEAIEPKGWRAVHRLNVGGTELMSRVAVERAFLRGGGGSIVNVTLSPHHGLPGMTHSTAARAAVEGYTREWSRLGVAVVAVAAGHFDTESLRKYPEPVWRAAASSVPLGRLGREAECVAGRACVLAAGPRPLGLRDHAGRRARQLVRPLAAPVAGRRGRCRADRGTPPGGVLTAGIIPRPAGEVLWLHRSLPSF